MLVCNHFGLEPSADFPLSWSMACGLVGKVIGKGAPKLALFSDGACSGVELAGAPREPTKYIGIACSWAATLLGSGLGSAGCTLAPPAGTALGSMFESKHELDVAIDVAQHGKCIKYSPTHFGSPWLADDCAPGDKGFTTLPVHKPEAPAGGSGPSGGGSGSGPGLGPGATPPGGGSSGGNGIEEAPLASMLPAWTGYLYAGDLPRVFGMVGNGAEPSSVDSPPGTWTVENSHGSSDANLIGILDTPGKFSFHVFWHSPSGPRSGPFEIEVGPPDVTLPPTALEHLGVVADYGAWLDALRPSPDKDFIAAVAGQPEILLVYDVGARTLTQLTSGIDRAAVGVGGLLANLAWSPDGRYLAFTSSEPGPAYDIYLYDTATHDLSRLTENGGSFNPVWSPDGTLLAFNQLGHLAVYQPSTAQTELLPCPTWAGCQAVASSDNFSSEPWSADSEHLTYQTLNQFSSPSGVMVWDRATDSARTLAEDVTGVRLSADGMRAMVGSTEAGVVEFINVASGAVEHTYSQAGLSVDSFALTMTSAWSPDGEYVSAWRCASSHCGPSVMTVDTGVVEDIAAPSGVIGTLSGWRGNEPLWCYPNSSGTLDCVTGAGGSPSVTHLDTWKVLGMDGSGYFGEFGGEYQPYAVATWNEW